MSDSESDHEGASPIPSDSDPSSSTRPTTSSAGPVLPSTGEEAGRLSGKWLAFAPVLLLALPFHRLAGYDPTAGHSVGVRPIEDFFFGTQATTPWLVVGLAAWLAWRRREALTAQAVTGAEWLTAGLFWTAGAALLGWSVHTQATHLLAPSLALSLLGSATALGGIAATRRFALPAAFLLFAVPVPAPLANEIVYGLQRASTDLASGLLGLFGFDHRVSGDLIYQGGRVFQVIEGCSGFRSTLMLPMVTIIYLELSYRNRLQAAILLGLSPLIAFGMNGFRILSMILNPDSDLETVHTTQGIVTIVAGVLVIALLDIGLDRLGLARPRVPQPDRATPAGPSAMPRPRRLIGVAAVAVGLALIPHFVPVWAENAKGGFTLVGFPAMPLGWKRVPLDFDAQFHGSLHFDERVSSRFSDGSGARVDAVVGVDHRLDPNRSLLSSRAILPGPGARILEEHRSRATPSGLVVDEVRLLRNGQEELVWAWFEEAAGLPTEALRAAWALDRGQTRRPASLLFVRLATPIGRDGAGLSDAKRRLGLLAETTRERLAQANRTRFAP